MARKKLLNDIRYETTSNVRFSPWTAHIPAHSRISTFVAEESSRASGEQGAGRRTAVAPLLAWQRVAVRREVVSEHRGGVASGSRVGAETRGCRRPRASVAACGPPASLLSTSSPTVWHRMCRDDCAPIISCSEMCPQTYLISCET